LHGPFFDGCARNVNHAAVWRPGRLGIRRSRVDHFGLARIRRAATVRNLVANAGPNREAMIFHVCRRTEWRDALRKGAYAGSSQDVADGFIHFSNAEQVRGSVAKHRRGQDGLVILAVDDSRLGDALKWEPSRGGALFPHLYGDLDPDAVVGVSDLPLGPDGAHAFPDLSAPDAWTDGERD